MDARHKCEGLHACLAGEPWFVTGVNVGGSVRPREEADTCAAATASATSLLLAAGSASVPLGASCGTLHLPKERTLGQLKPAKWAYICRALSGPVEAATCGGITDSTSEIFRSCMMETHGLLQPCSVPEAVS